MGKYTVKSYYFTLIMLFYPRPNWRTSTHSILTWDIKFAKWPILSPNKTPCYPGYLMMSIHVCMWGKILFWLEAPRGHLPAPLHLPNFPLVLSVSDRLWSPEITRMRALNKQTPTATQGIVPQTWRQTWRPWGWCSFHCRPPRALPPSERSGSSADPSPPTPTPISAWNVLPGPIHHRVLLCSLI